MTLTARRQLFADHCECAKVHIDRAAHIAAKSTGEIDPVEAVKELANAMQDIGMAERYFTNQHPT